MLVLSCSNYKIKGLDKELCMSKTIGCNYFVKSLFNRASHSKVRTS